jgi:diguanylate cyclase (GGDEF)-like protein
MNAEMNIAAPMDADSIDRAKLMELVVERANLGVFALNRDFRVLLWNRFMADHSGQLSQDVVGRNLFDCFPELPRKWLEKKVQGVFLLKNLAFTSWEQRPYLFRFRHDRPVTGGVDHMFQSCTFLPMKNAAGEVTAVCITLLDATDTAIAYHELERTMTTVRENSRRDGLTGMFNRRHFEERLSEEFYRSRRYGAPLALVMFDIDHFKRVNDVHGHLAGDEVLRVLAGRVSAAVRMSDILGRYGGEEFGVILPQTDLAGARVVAGKLRELVCSQPVDYKDARLDVTVSCGVAEAVAEYSTYEDVIRIADAALYRAKQEGRNRVCG